ncbi:WD40/YVTN/BNR-like repeat-containing protein [Flavobacterium lacisediminis]|uniref:Oxidoreductase n=1 Tax=Flavobacterium lacisediminis TaxID=2989705 RepID=A0ABT3EK84_9FLAO|nr:oxidoreductase [Flavobacterium lacisediminis]MCW1148988.1 oxidoreductase [Flavobacterium lacisediminis]
MKKTFLLLLFISLTSLAQNKKIKSEVILETKMSCRAILVDDEKIWLGMDKGRYGFYDKKKDTTILKDIQSVARNTEFRSIAGTKEAIFILAVGNPAMLIRIDKKTLEETVVYKEEHEKVFYDSMQFVDELNGFAMGDPIESCLAFIKTNDGGKTWHKVNCDVLPKVSEGEAAFATSNTNLTIKGKSIFMVSGGKKSRVFVSKDFGVTWKVYETPIVQGEEMTGIFTADFYNEKIGIIAGGNYMKQDQNWANKAITKNGGKTWKLIAEKEAFGYASCVQFVPNSKGKQLISVGGTGMFYSDDFGKSWTKFSDDKDFFTFRFESEKVFYATGKNKLVQFIIE